MSVRLDYKDLLRFEICCERLGEKTALKAARKAAQKGATLAGRAVRNAAPVGKTGQLKKGFKKKAEKSRKRGKFGYQYAMDRAKNDIFQKPIKRPGILGGKNDKGYYPASVEYGFLARAPGGGYTYQRRMRGSNQYAEKTEESYKLPSQHIEGQYFVRDAAKAAEPAVIAEMKRVLNEELDKEWAKK